jgi:D-glycero-alpha-D-manno-heptose-7-phosphate kinase
MVITRTPFRISFFGGGTDFPTWVQRHGGEVLGTTIDKYCYISVRELPPFFEHKHRLVYSKIENVGAINEIKHPAVPEAFKYMKIRQGLELHHDGDLPARSGMGSGSSFGVGLLNALHALKGEFVSRRELALQAIHLEQDLFQENVGSQDQILTATSGFNRVIFKPTGGHIIEPVIISLERQRELESHLLLFYTGISRFASEVAKTQVDNFKNRKKELQAMGQMVTEALAILGSNSVDIKEFGKLLNENWKLKRSLSGSVSNQAIGEMYKTAINHGAIGGGILGVGGGGFLLVFAGLNKHKAIIGGLKHLLHVPIKFERSGIRVVLYEPDMMAE